jgi:hypothetical protein
MRNMSALWIEEKVHRLFVSTNRQINQLWGRSYQSQEGSLKEKCRLKVPIKDVRCNKKLIAQRQGFSAKTIDHFPPCQFFKLYLSNPEKSFEAFCEWYKEWFVKNEVWRISKRQGGMRTGALIRTVKHLHEQKYGLVLEDMRRADKGLVEEAIRVRVQYYFDLFNAIRKNGFNSTFDPPVYCFFKNGLYFIHDGHHRVSALWALGHQEVDVAVIK